MTDQPTLGTAAIVVLAFLFRLGALVCLVLLWRYFHRARGPLVLAFRHVWGTFAFLLAWVTVASIAELVGYISGASAFVEYSGAYIFIPNAVIFIALLRLLMKLHATEVDQ